MPQAIDIHVHPATQEFHDALGPFMEATSRYFRQEIPVRTVDAMAEEYTQADVLAVLLAWDAETATGLPPVTNDFVASVVRAHPDRFIGFGSVDPLKGAVAVTELERAVTELGLRGLKFHPGAQAFYPHEERHFPLWERAQELGVPVLVHVGTTGLGAGVDGGGGILLDHMRPIWLDTVAANFPRLQIICAHGGWPWQDELIAMALHKPNVYIDLSGWSPKYFSPAFVRDIGGRLQDKVLFGTDYPFITPRRWLNDFAALDLSDAVRQKILYGNAARLLGLP